MNTTYLIIKSRTVAMQLQKTNPSAARHLIKLIDRWDALRFAQRKICDRNPMCALPSPHNGTQLLKEIHVASNRTLFIMLNHQLFDALCLCVGNAYKADSWLAKRVQEVGDLSDDTIRSYLMVMFKEVLSRHEPIHFKNNEEAAISSVISHIIQ
ncbi:hypothetical protein Acife_2092 [Acidithiobacillus ferrivorans SS3]|uniref:Uncharacterized protein n=1 Tax=Acidithiobacillus ferrivorans SS3 TaxID=743299 RepID=G0JMS8_9PROT|nr:hypothetical protein [Acidithiobacillus ferrivorans]AEM48211.1 hypothetical protein Acife_2092 [Acidithiobacillus ferrivorans SS3]OFA15228.1 hypothetical protein A4U49_14430 [Acidithiobacillus ferrivorans]